MHRRGRDPRCKYGIQKTVALRHQEFLSWRSAVCCTPELGRSGPARVRMDLATSARISGRGAGNPHAEIGVQVFWIRLTRMFRLGCIVFVARWPVRGEINARGT